jgi:hypothetical protein
MNKILFAFFKSSKKEEAPEKTWELVHIEQNKMKSELNNSKHSHMGLFEKKNLSRKNRTL